MKKIISNLLKENTGEHMLDSGGAYGRAWQKNQSRDFAKEKKYTWDDCGITLNVYHYLTENLSVSVESRKYQAMYKRFTAKSEACGLTDMENFIELLQERDILQSDNYFIVDPPECENTYNHESLLSQVLQYILFFNGEKYFILLQIHGGCDVRGGYTSPRIFEIDDIEEFISQDTRCTVRTKRAVYYTDDTYNFYFEELVDNEPNQDKVFEDSEIRDNKTYTFEELLEEGILAVYS